ncbi:hypothetical protein SAMN05421504_108208 [Amycolatopsis xylanica]|uniref:DUF4386 domain-containing protein n=1 Tax=Amycolatopsis xylanica TaxID=589385 RepID=A0A1H3PGM9_9PSEU|nr:DUF4386 family protein [Amycolatopsis xylanica]SDZ00294.1 hypothetical protein SAMN05421504_108208 [Amycolatopsis xylanica]
MTRLNDPRVLRLGGWLAIAGTILSVVVNALHPHQDIGTDPFMVEVHEAGGMWIPLHYGISVAVVLDLFAMLAIGKTLRGIDRPDIVRYANGTAVVSAAVMLVLMGIDGFSTKHIADFYVAAQGAEKTAAYPVAYLILLLLLALLGLWYALFFGVAMPLYSIAMLRSTFYPRWLGLLGLTAGIGGLITGSLTYLLGSSFLVTTLMFLLFSSLGFLWLLLAGVRQLKVASEEAKVPETAEGALR